jgi:predicted transcriptional regulator
LNTNEQQVLQLITDYLQANSTFSIEGILPYLYERISNSSSLTKRDVVLALYSLVEKRYVIKGYKITKDKVLTNETRNKIYDFIVKHPGTFTRQIRDELKIGSNEFVWHSEILINFQFIREHQIGNGVAFFDSKLSDTDDIALYFLRNKKTLSIFQQLMKNGPDFGVTPNELADVLSIAQPTIDKHLERLMQIGVVSQKIEGPSTKFFLNSEKFGYFNTLI